MLKRVRRDGFRAGTPRTSDVRFAKAPKARSPTELMASARTEIAALESRG